jgi:nicotinamide-nucleotide amidase
MTEALETKIVRLLADRKQTLALAESCTGGYLAHRVTNVPGASAIFSAGFVTYSNEAKQQFLGVSGETLHQHGSVSEPVAREMAEGALRVSRTDYAIAVTGIAGPDGATPDKPVGTVFIAVTSPRETRVFREFNPGGRLAFKETTSEQALGHLHALIQSAE